MSISITDGTIPIITPVGTYNAWTKKYGYDTAKYRILILQGGPGTAHDYLDELGPRLAQYDLQVIFYGPIGTHYSDKPDNTNFYNMEWFVNEVEQVRSYYNITSDKFILLGQSWGGQLAIDYALKFQDRLLALIISNAVSSMPAYNKFCLEKIIPSYPQDKWKIINDLFISGDLDNPLLMETFSEIHLPVHVYRHPFSEWPAKIMATFQTRNLSMYFPACGKHPITVKGYLDDWDRSNELKSIKIPTLTVGARFDTMDPDHMKWMSTQVQRGSYVFCPNSGHFAHLDDAEVWDKGVIDFINAL